MKKKKKVEDETLLEMLVIMWKDGYKKDVISYLKVAIPIFLLFGIASIYIVLSTIYNYFL